MQQHDQQQLQLMYDATVMSGMHEQPNARHHDIFPSYSGRVPQQQTEAVAEQMGDSGHDQHLKDQGASLSSGHKPSHRGSSSTDPGISKVVSSTLALPPIADRLLQSEMHKLLGDTWKQRKVVLTNQGIFFSRLDQNGEEKCCDKILLQDICMLDDREFDVTSGQSMLTYRHHAQALHEDADPDCLIQLETIETEQHCARKYLLRAQAPQMRTTWINLLNERVSQAQKDVQMRNKFVAYQKNSRRIFQATATRWLFALCILSSFVCDALEMQYLPFGRGNTSLGKTFFILELIFTIIFTLELAWNMFTFWFWEFWSDSWSLFDTVVVLSSIASVGSEGASILVSLSLCLG